MGIRKVEKAATGARRPTARLATIIGAAAAVTVVGGAVGGHANAQEDPSVSAQTHSSTSSQTLVLDPRHSFAMTATPSVKATPYWGEPKAG